VELLVVVAVIGVLATIAIPLYANVLARGRIAKAQADSRSLAAAVGVYSATWERSPRLSLSSRPSRRTRRATARAVHEFGARPPGGWATYFYSANVSAAPTRLPRPATVPASAFRSAARQRRFERIAS